MVGQMKQIFKNTKPLAEGKTRFTVEYTGFGATFFTEIDDVDEELATNQFKKFYPSARFIQILKTDK